jgi:transaldolase
MKATETLHEAGQSLWLDNITRRLLTSGTLKHYIDTLSITGLTSNPTMFDHAISKSAAYDGDIRAMTKRGISGEDLFFRLAIADLQQAADLFRPAHDRTAGVDALETESAWSRPRRAAIDAHLICQSDIIATPTRASPNARRG